MGDKKKKNSKIDKILMGAVIGGAIGSVVGAAIAPKKGKETREEIAESAKKAKKHSIKIIGKIKNFFNKKEKQNKEAPKKIPHEHV